MKTLSGALVPYGNILPAAISTPDGAMFYKTDNTGGAAGLYVYGFIADTNLGQLGNQAAQGWSSASVASAAGVYVLSGGDTMTGALTVPSFLRVTQLSGVQRLMIGNQDGLGTARPGIVQGSNGTVTIGHGSSWAGSGGTFSPGLTVDVIAGTAGLTYQGGQVWHVGNDGVGSLLDAGLFAGQLPAYYLNASNMSTGILPVARGGTNNGGTVIGGVAFGGSATQLNYTLAGTSGQVLVSGGTATPVWVNQSALSVGSATTASTATSATTAGTATTATTATNVAWTGITGLPGASQALSTAGFPTTARPALFYDFGNSGTASMTPPNFPTSSLTGFDGYTTSDIGTYQVGLTVMGTAGAGARGLQLAADWNFEEAAPTGLRFRVNDDTGTLGTWGAFRTIWDQGNLTNLSQLSNGPGYVTGATLGNYVLKAGDTMTGGLSTTALAVNASLGGAGTITAGSNITALGFVSASGNVVSNGGNVTALTGSHITGNIGTTGSLRTQNGGGTNTGYVEFLNAAGTRQAYIGYGSGINLQYLTENGLTNHAFSGSITATGNVTAYASDGRLKMNIIPIANAIEKVVSLGGYEYDWNMIKCDELGFTPEREHEHGLIAQDVEKVLPDAVAPAPFDNRYKTVRYDRVVALLTAAIGEQQKQIEALLAKVTALEAK